MPYAAEQASGAVRSLWRHPVKSMAGEELDTSEITARGLLGDRAYALIDRADGKVASAKNPRKWPHLFDFGAAFDGSLRSGAALPAVRITLPDGTAVKSGEPDVDAALSGALHRPVRIHRPPLCTRQLAGQDIGFGQPGQHGPGQRSSGASGHDDHRQYHFCRRAAAPERRHGRRSGRRRHPVWPPAAPVEAGRAQPGSTSRRVRAQRRGSRRRTGDSTVALRHRPGPALPAAGTGSDDTVRPSSVTSNVANPAGSDCRASCKAAAAATNRN